MRIAKDREQCNNRLQQKKKTLDPFLYCHIDDLKWLANVDYCLENKSIAITSQYA